jgi:hypothetical protein
MPELNDKRREAFAQERARGVKPTAAYAAAGYAPSRSGPNTVNRRADVVERVAELVVQLEALRKASLEETILAMLDLAAKADPMSAASLKEARNARLDAYRLSALVTPWEREAPPPRRMTTAEWVAEYAAYGAKVSQ